MDLNNIKDIINKMEFMLRMAQLDIDAVDVKDIPVEEAEREMKRLTVGMNILCGRLQAASENNVVCDFEEDTEDLITEEHVQLSLFPFEY